MKSHNQFSGTLAEAAAEPARTLSSWQGEGALTAILQPTCHAGELAQPGQRGWQQAEPSKEAQAGGEGNGFGMVLPSSKGKKKRKRDSFLVGRLPGDVSQVHIYCLLPVKLCFYASQSHHFDVVCLA